MITKTPETKKTTGPPPVLTLKDRCDATASRTEQALVRFFHKETRAIIDLCYHHANQHEASLIGQGYSAVEDRREMANKDHYNMPGSVPEQVEEPNKKVEDAD